MKLIEFFAGSRSVSQQAETLGFETFSVDFMIDVEKNGI